MELSNKVTPIPSQRKSDIRLDGSNLIIPKICTPYLHEVIGRSRWRWSMREKLQSDVKYFSDIQGGGGGGERMLLFISRGDFGNGSNRINYSGFNENFSAYSSVRLIYIFRRCLVKYGMQHTQEPQGCTYVNRQREGCRVCGEGPLPRPGTGFGRACSQG